MRCQIACCVLLPFAVSVSELRAQGVQPLTGSYRFVRPSLRFGGSCGSGPVLYFEEGVLALAANGTFGMSGSWTEICAVGTSTGPSSAASNSTYVVGGDGTVQFDFDPGNPGVQVARLFTRPDGSVLLHTPDNPTDEGTLALAVRLSSGRSNASLNGSYHVVRIAWSNGAAGIAAATDLGQLVFDGAGNCAGTVARHNVTATGVTSLSTAPIGGAYNVAADGQLRFLPGAANAPGAVSADGELFFAAEQSGADAWLLVGVRQGQNHTLADLRGAWGCGDLDLHHGSGAALPVFSTDSVLLDADAAGGLGGQDYWIDNQNGSPPVRSVGLTTLAGSVLQLGSDGQLQLQWSPTGRSPRTFSGALSSDRCFLIGMRETNAVSNLMLGLRRPPWPTLYGTPTPGSGQFAPLLRSSGGFACPGNAAFALQLEQAVGGSFGLICFATRPAAPPGLPLLGGTAWIDPASIAGWIGVVTSGTPGAPGVGTATLPLPLPALPPLRGMQCWLQAIVLDAGAPQGLAFSLGLDLQLAR